MNRVTPSPPASPHTPGPPDTAAARAPLAMIAANAKSTSVQTVLVIAWRGTLGEKKPKHVEEMLIYFVHTESGTVCTAGMRFQE